MEPDELPPACGDCHATRQVIWSPVFNAWLCPDHLRQRSYKLVEPT